MKIELYEGMFKWTITSIKQLVYVLEGLRLSDRQINEICLDILNGIVDHNNKLTELKNGELVIHKHKIELVITM